MYQVLPLSRLQRSSCEARFALCLPNPILGQSYFLWLMRPDGWSYEPVQEALVAERHLVLRERMWVRSGGAAWSVTTANNRSFEVCLKIHPGTPPRIYRQSAGQEVRLGEHPGLRLPRLLERSLIELRCWPRQRLVFYCEPTRRRLDLSWDFEMDDELVRAWTEALRASQCH